MNLDTLIALGIIWVIIDVSRMLRRMIFDSPAREPAAATTTDVPPCRCVIAPVYEPPLVRAQYELARVYGCPRSIAFDVAEQLRHVS